MGEEPVDKHPLRTLGISLAAGVSMFVTGLFLLLWSLLVYGGAKFDPSVWNFYLLVAFAGAVFGFERWWAYESGGVNPFHDR